MRLSEAIRLGSLTFGRLEAGGAAGRCALNCALAAVGTDELWQDAATAWPWLGECCANPPRPYHRNSQYLMLVAWLFDYSVMKGTMTLEALCDRVRAWERELAAKGINVEQVAMAAELNQPASPTQSIQESPESLEQDVAK